MKNITDHEGRTYLQAPIRKNGEAWVQLNFYGKPDRESLFKTMCLIEEMYNAWAEETAAEQASVA